VQRDAKSPEDAPEDISAELSDAQDGETLDGKVTLRLKNKYYRYELACVGIKEG